MWERARQLLEPSRRVELRLLRALEREPGRFVPVSTLRCLCADENLPPSQIDPHLRDLATRLDQRGVARLDRGAGSS